MKKGDLTIVLLIILLIFALCWGVARADKICTNANSNNYNAYRFCMGI